ncbi:MAG: amidohydrolase/deacetylase family metallohydrolase [Acidimicrobiia bacterium]
MPTEPEAEPGPLRIRGGRVLDPGAGVDAVQDVVIEGGVIRESAPPHSVSERVIDATGLIVVPGLVDHHVHVHTGISPFGVDADLHCLHRGVTTAVDAGSAGARTYDDFAHRIIETSETDLVAFLNISAVGLSRDGGELTDPRWLEADRAVATATAHPDRIIGIKIRMGARSAGAPDEPHALRTAKAVARQAGIPLMAHISAPSLPLEETVGVLTERDVITHCYHGKQGGILDEHGRVLPFVRAAVERGVRLDVGHGRSGFSFEVARRAIADGIVPHHISSDIHTKNVEGPAYDLITTVSKLIHVGLPLEEALHAATRNPATSIGRGDTIGTLAAGTPADITVLENVAGKWNLEASSGGRETLEHLLVPRWVVKDGRPIRLEPSIHER